MFVALLVCLFLAYLLGPVAVPLRNSSRESFRPIQPLVTAAPQHGGSAWSPQNEDRYLGISGSTNLIYIAIEGIEYSGKTELVNALKRELEKHKLVVQTYNDYFPRDLEPDSQIRFLNYLVAHYKVSKKINYDLKSRQVDIVITERSFITPLVYEFFQNHDSREKIDCVENFMYEVLGLKDLLPEIIYYIDITPEMAFKIGNSREKDTISLEKLEESKRWYASSLEEMRHVFGVKIKHIKWHEDIRIMVSKIMADLI